MTTYTVNLSEAENLAMSSIAIDINEWIQNVCHDRARIAIEEIVKIVVDKCLENNVQIPGSKDEIVLLGFQNNWVSALTPGNTI